MGCGTIGLCLALTLKQLPFFKGMAKEVSIQFVRVYRKKDFAIAAQMAEKEPLYEKIITHVLPAEEAQKGFGLLLTGGTGAVKVSRRFIAVSCIVTVTGIWKRLETIIRAIIMVLICIRFFHFFH